MANLESGTIRVIDAYHSFLSGYEWYNDYVSLATKQRVLSTFVHGPSQLPIDPDFPLELVELIQPLLATCD